MAEKLGITDRAVSKWETGKSMPDSSIMLELCEILEITVNELLSGEKIDMESYEKKADENLIALKRKDENNMTKNVIISLLFSVTLSIGIMVCVICNLAISGNLTWSLIPVSSIVFVWVISFPSIILGKKGVVVSLISLSIFSIPFLFLISNLIKVKDVFSVGAIMAVISIVFLWIVVAIFNHIGKTKRLIALGTTFLLAIPFILIINIILSKMIAEPPLDVWDMLSIFILLILAFGSFVYDYAQKKGLIK
ncbi:helix-turn-helix domain-containing protein [Bianquea renquensis]|uniref:Helix-turn-helix transcriptional regulator n=1 Tax=Bianquea renquensis TaxID=2763661 RepID=A0A926I123_9FIRM|nr:helix-turn-helix transcriptional regulator [Bianquea renquensis]MBC8542825.1 helix-turn-helix transcriptional regulator [Bianquea renquensis]